MAWTDEMVEELKLLWAQGITTGEIGKRLGISKNSIVGKVHRLGLEGRPSPIKKTDDTSNKSAPSKSSNSKSEKKVANVAKDTEKAKASKPVKKVATEKIEKKEVAGEKSVATKSEEKLPTKKLKEDVQIEEEDIKLINSLHIKSEKECSKENISLTELDNHTCRWPLGDPKDPDFHFCGRKVKTGQTYCEEHSGIAYVKPIRR